MFFWFWSNFVITQIGQSKKLTICLHCVPSTLRSGSTYHEYIICVALGFGKFRWLKIIDNSNVREESSERQGLNKKYSIGNVNLSRVTVSREELSAVYNRSMSRSSIIIYRPAFVHRE